MVKEFRTIQALLRATDEVLQILWTYTEKYTLLMNELLAAVPRHQQFEQWKRKGTISKETVDKEILLPLKKDLRFTGLPSRLYVSALAMTVQTYEAWLQQQVQRYWKLLGNQRWYNVISSGAQLAATASLSFEQIQTRAHEVLQQTQQAAFDSQPPNPPEQTSEFQDALTAMEKRSLVGKLLDAYDETIDSLTQLAIVHLLLNGFQVAEEESTPEGIAKRLEAKKIEIVRLGEQLKSKLPKGRDPLGDRFCQDIDSAITAPLPRDGALEAFAAEFDQWLDQKQIRLFDPAHYPVVFQSQTDLIWSKVMRDNRNAEESGQISSVLEPKAPAKKRRSKKRRCKIPQTRICVCFHTMRDLKFELYCDRRQLPYFEQFLLDYEEHIQRDDSETFSAGLFLLRSVTLFWVKDNTLHREMKKQQRKQAGSIKDLPALPSWKTHRLYLHVAIDDEALSTEGTERLRQKKLEKYNGRLQRSKAKLDKIEEEQKAIQQQRPLTAHESKKIQSQRTSVKQTQTTIERLGRSTPERSSQPTYQGQDSRVMAISFDRKDPVTITAVDKLHPSTQFHCSTEDLLIYHRARVKAVNRNVRLFKLKRRRWLPTNLEYKYIHCLGKREAAIFLVLMRYRLEKTGHTILCTKLQYQLLRVSPLIANIPTLLLLNLDTTNIMSDYHIVARLHKQHEEAVLKRAQDQQLRDRYRKNLTESNTREHIARIIAAAAVKLAIELQIGLIVVPDLRDIREKVEAHIRAEAQREYPNNYGAQKNYAQKTRDSFHRWNYRQLSVFIQERARKGGVAIAVMRQPLEGSLTEKATKMATEYRPEYLLQASD